VARQQRFDISGYYHVVNRGVGRMAIFLDEKDHSKFMQILQDSRDVHQFSVHAHVLMPNHYHLLMQTGYANLSEAMKQINARYSIFFNKKYNRIGPLWQGRFKSWFVHDEAYLRTVIKYIEYNPVKAGICEKLGQFKWASRYSLSFTEEKDLSNGLSKVEQKQIAAHFGADVVKGADTVTHVTQDHATLRHTRLLADYFLDDGGAPGSVATRNWQIIRAVQDGFKQKDIAEHLDITNAQVSRIMKLYRQKNRLFETVKKRGESRAFSDAPCFTQATEAYLCRQVLKHGNAEDIQQLTELFGKKVKKLTSDPGFLC
jgi:putative transposase